MKEVLKKDWDYVLRQDDTGQFRNQAVLLGTNFSQYNLIISGNLFPMFVADEKPLTVGWLQWHLFTSLLFPLMKKKQKI